MSIFMRNVFGKGQITISKSYEREEHVVGPKN